MTKKEFTVLVTGFGANLNAPYGNKTSNPSSLIARILPLSLPPSHPLNPTSDTTISILDPVGGGFDTIPGTYALKRPLVKDLHSKYGDKVDLWIHLGRGPWNFVTCERRAFSQDFTSSWLGEDARKGYYLYRDNTGCTASDMGPCPWREAGVPMGLDSELDVNGIVEGANASLGRLKGVNGEQQHLEVRSHIESGAAGCGFIFYESMANCFVAGRKRNVLFCHVPRHTEQEELEKGRDAILAIIGASIASLIAKEGVEPGDWKQEFGLVP